MPAISYGFGANQTRKDCTFWDRPYHVAQRGGYLPVDLMCPVPVAAEGHWLTFVGIADDETNPFTFIVIEASNQSTVPLYLRINDLYPSIITAAQEQIDTWVRQVVSRWIAQMVVAIKDKLKSGGLT